jgi:aryl-alcohol dehydrogenase-like predicted oxidoreductase
LKTVQNSGNPVFDKVASTPKNWEIVDALNSVAKELGKPASAVALNWITKRPGVSATLIGATKIDQLKANLQALDFDIPAPLSAKLEEISRPELGTPYMFFGDSMQQMISGGTTVTASPPWFGS